MPKKKVSVEIGEPTQQSLPGSEDERLPELEEVASNWLVLDKKLPPLRAQYKSLGRAVVDIMKSRGLDIYRCNGFIVRRAAGPDKIQVSIGKK